MQNSGCFKLGHVMSEEVRAKISESMKGRATRGYGFTHSEETKAKMSAGKKGKIPVWAVKRGEEHYNWKGGISTEDKLLRDKFAKTMRKNVLERDDYTCQICKQRGGDLQVDHIQSWATYPEIRFDMNNCRTLCSRCHYKLTFNKDMPETTKVWGHNKPRRIKS